MRCSEFCPLRDFRVSGQLQVPGGRTLNRHLSSGSTCMDMDKRYVQVGQQQQDAPWLCSETGLEFPVLLQLFLDHLFDGIGGWTERETDGATESLFDIVVEGMLCALNTGFDDDEIRSCNWPSALQ